MMHKQISYCICKHYCTINFKGNLSTYEALLHIAVSGVKLPVVAFCHLPSSIVPESQAVISNGNYFLRFPRHVFEVPLDCRNRRKNLTYSTFPSPFDVLESDKKLLYN